MDINDNNLHTVCTSKSFIFYATDLGLFIMKHKCKLLTDVGCEGGNGFFSARFKFVHIQPPTNYHGMSFIFILFFFIIFFLYTPTAAISPSLFVFYLVFFRLFLGSFTLLFIWVEMQKTIILEVGEFWFLTLIIWAPFACHFMIPYELQFYTHPTFTYCWMMGWSFWFTLVH